MTQAMPISYFHKRMVIFYEKDGSYNIPLIGQDVLINNCIFTVISKILKPYENGARQYFIDLETKKEA